MKNRGLVATIVIMSGIIVMLIVTLLLIKLPTIVGIKSILLDETQVTVESIEESIEETTETEPVKTIDTSIENYSGYNGYVNIEYPVITGMVDAELEERINNKLKMNALSIVSLYPISTALQKLDIYCTVKKLDDDYITVLYNGQVVGRSVKNPSSTGESGSSSGGSGTRRSSSSNDPYLNGFVDPLAGGLNQGALNPGLNGYNQGLAGIMNKAVQNHSNVINDGNSSLPLPNSGGSTEVYRGNVSNNNSKAVIKNQSTADAGPTVYNEPAPTAAKASPNKKSTVYDGNVATNNPTSQIINPLVPNSQAPNGAVTSNANVVQNTPPVYGYAGSNNSASTIDQRIFYTNTIDLKTCLDVKLSDIADPATLAKYARSSNVEFVNIDDTKRTEVRNYIKRTVQSKLTEDLTEKADFRNTELSVWPKHFSYIDDDGSVCFTIKLSSKLGNYVIVKYNGDSNK